MTDPTRFSRPRRRRTVGVATVLMTLATAAASRSQPTTRPVPEASGVSAATGDVVRPLDVAAPQRAAVVLFVATDCPISNGYAPTVAAIARAFADRGVNFYLVYSDADVRPADALRHQTAYALPGTAVLDPARRLSRALHARVTPQAFVIGPGGIVRYDGPVDDQYAAVGRKRFAPTHHYLTDALTQVLAGEKVGVDHVTPVGCGLN